MPSKSLGAQLAETRARIAQLEAELAAVGGVASPAVHGGRGGTVIVCSKLPMSIDLQLCEMRNETRRVRETVWQEEVAAKVGPVVRVNGTSYPRGEPPAGFRGRPQMAGGFAMTFGVDAEWWARWLEMNRQAPFIASGMVWAVPNRQDAQAKARELASLRSGLDPIALSSDRTQIEDDRMPKPIKGLELSGEPGPTDADAAA